MSVGTAHYLISSSCSVGYRLNFFFFFWFVLIVEIWIYEIHMVVVHFRLVDGLSLFDCDFKSIIYDEISWKEIRKH